MRHTQYLRPAGGANGRPPWSSSTTSCSYSRSHRSPASYGFDVRRLKLVDQISTSVPLLSMTR